MSPTALIIELRSHGITVRADGDQLRLDGARGTLTPKLLEAVKSYKRDLLEILTPNSHLRVGSGVGELHATGARATLSRDSVPQSYADIEWDRFITNAVPTPTGGLRSPDCSAALARKIRSGGVSFENMVRFEANCAHLGRRAKS